MIKVGVDIAAVGHLVERGCFSGKGEVYPMVKVVITPNKYYKGKVGGIGLIRLQQERPIIPRLCESSVYFTLYGIQGFCTDSEMRWQT